MKDISKKTSQVKRSCEGAILARKIGEGSSVGLKRTYDTPEALVEWLKHFCAYKYAEPFAEGNLVLDLGCGTGYGTHELSTKAYESVGIDIWKNGIRHCHREYGKKNSFLVASGNSLPFKNDSFDLVVSFQVIEHIHPNAVLNYLEEIERILKYGGILIVSTPNKRLRLLPFQKPWNPDHKREYDAEELERLLKSVFKKVKILGLSATRDVYLIKYNRVKPSPLHVYVLNPVISAVNRVLSTSLIIIKLKTVATEKLTKNQRLEATNHKLSLRDFRFSERNLDASIDIYGICTKIEVVP